MPDSPRWEKFKLPKMGGYVQVSGEVVGFHEVKDRLSLCMRLNELNYLPLSLKPPSSTIDNNTISSSTTTSPETPRKRLRLQGERPRIQQTPLKQPRQDTNTQASSVDVIISSSYAESVANDGNNRKRSSSSIGTLDGVTVTMIKHAVEMLQVYALAGVQFED